ncbi:MAG: phosphatidate cytidylyltransferase [Porphyromonas sp.]|nr:phosphatidate cytidylyltransferase [Porphyromonas sp.]
MINKKLLLTRSLTGAVYVGLILACILTDQVVLMAWLLALFAMLGSYEYQVMTKANVYALFLKIWHALMSGLLVYTSYELATYTGDFKPVLMAILPYMLYVLFYLIGEIYRLQRLPAVEVGHAFFSHLYVAIPLGLLLMLTGDRYGIAEVLGADFAFPRTFWLLPVFVTIWLNDTGAFLVGSLLGRHKLLERVSPNKTWEGAIGGAVLAIAGCIGFYYLFPEVTAPAHWMILGFIIVFFSNYGDLFESFLKRSYGVKDSGNLLPGHGGILDRIDSLLFVSIPALLYINMVVLQH